MFAYLVSKPTHSYAYYGISWGPLDDQIVKVAMGTGAALPSRIGFTTGNAGEQGFDNGTGEAS